MKGFYFNDHDLDKKQHLNLSESAWIIIEQDISNFSPFEQYLTTSGFLNIIFTNFYSEAEASVNYKCLQKKDELDSLFNSKGLLTIEEKNKQEIKQQLLESYKNGLIIKNRSYKKGIGKKIRINKENVNILKNSPEAEIYDGSIGLYLKAIFEEYCEKSLIERELIFFRQNVEKIKIAISEGKKIKINQRKKYSEKQNRYQTRQYYVSPYKIINDSTKSFNYLVGYSEIVSSDFVNKKSKIVSLRLSRIEKISVMNSMSGFLSKENRKIIEQEILEKGVQFMAGDIEKITIKLTKKGIENFDRQTYMKPLNYKIIDSENGVFEIYCTEVQAINYFFKFGKDVEILQPLELRTKFIERYKSALKNYEEMNYE